jgi:hypothetical protein
MDKAVIEPAEIFLEDLRFGFLNRCLTSQIEFAGREI